MLASVLFLSLGLWSLGFVLARRLVGIGEPASRGERTGLSVVIPARNEAHNLPALLKSLAAQVRASDEILVVDDGSTDCTGEVAAHHGAKVIVSQPLPAGWRGKTWACCQGARVASCPLLLFLDADTWWESEGLNRMLAIYQGGALSVGPYHAVQRGYEELSLFFNLNMNFGTAPRGLFGQMLLVDRESYLRVGGHEAVRDRTLENFWLAEKFHHAGIAVQSRCGRGILSFRMYPRGLKELIEGWTRGFASGASQTEKGVLLTVVGWMIGLMLAPLMWCITGDLWPWGVAYGLCAAQVSWLSQKIGSFRWGSAVAYPVPLVFFFALFARSVARSGKSVTWKGREIRAD